MHGGDFFFQAFVYLTAAVVSVPIAKRLGLGSVLGYLLAGIVIGPFALGLVGEEGQDVLHFAEFGVVLMLFLIGLELEPSRVWRLRAPILGLGGLQVGVTTVVLMAIALGFGVEWRTALAVGVASQAVGLVADRAVEIPVPVPIAVGDQSSLGPIGTPSTLAATSTLPAPAPPASTSTSTSTSITAPVDSASTTTTVGSATATTVGATTTTTSPPTTTAGSLDSGSFVVEGGQVSAACTGSSTIKLLGAVPAAGWSLEVESSGPEKVRVEFEMSNEESEIEITCENGLLRADIH